MPECPDIGHERSSNCACSSPSWQPAKRMDLGDGVSLAPLRLGPDGATVVEGGAERHIAMRAISKHDFRKQLLRTI